MLGTLRKQIANINGENAKKIAELCDGMKDVRASAGCSIDLDNITLADLKQQQRAHYRLGYTRGYLAALVKQHTRMKHIQRHYGEPAGVYALQLPKKAKKRQLALV